jgi:hypothetical protein
MRVRIGVKREMPKMTLYRVNIYTTQGNVYGQLRGADCERLSAALSADPETVEELECALGRYGRRPEGRGWLGDWQAGLAPGPNGFGVMHLDLATRLLAVDPQAFVPKRRGRIRWHDGRRKSDVQLPFVIAADWFLTNDLATFSAVQRERQERQKKRVRRDDRDVLFGKCPEYIATAVLTAAEQLRVSSERECHQFIRESHAKWQMTPRVDLDHHCPRDVMLDARHWHLCKDLVHQQHRWALLNAAPPGLPRTSSAYRYAGLGDHEIIIYYELIRELFATSIKRVRTERLTPGDWPEEVERLEKHLQDWMNFPQYELLSGRTPAAVIDRERRRLPEVISDEEEMQDCDCPLCQTMAEDQFGVTFWTLDDSGMDHEFAFSLFATKEEWDKEQAEWDAMDRALEKEVNANRPLQAPGTDAIESREELRNSFDTKSNPEAARGEQVDRNAFLSDPNSVWQNSAMNMQVLTELPPGQAVAVLLFSLGANIAELTEDLRHRPEHVDWLRSSFDQFRNSLKQFDAWQTSESIDELCGALDTIVEACPDLRAKGDDFKSRLEWFRTLRRGGSATSEVPPRS